MRSGMSGIQALQFTRQNRKWVLCDMNVQLYSLDTKTLRTLVLGKDFKLVDLIS